MSSIPRRRVCAKGQYCSHAQAGLEEPVSLRPSHRDDICDRYAQEHKGAVRAPKGAKWMKEVLKAIEAVLRRTLKETRPIRPPCGICLS